MPASKALPVYCDIDGTLTDLPTKKWGSPDMAAIEGLKDIIADGFEVVLWSGGGSQYAREFAEKYGIEAIARLGKPSVVIDDNSHIRPIQRIAVVNPKELRRDG